MFEFLNTPNYAQWRIKVHYSPYTGGWNIEEKSYDRGNVKANSTYGTGRINAYKIIEETLNLKDVRIFDYIEDDEGKRKAVLNKKETAIAQAKQELTLNVGRNLQGCTMKSSTVSDRENMMEAISFSVA